MFCPGLTVSCPEQEAIGMDELLLLVFGSNSGASFVNVKHPVLSHFATALQLPQQPIKSRSEN